MSPKKKYQPPAVTSWKRTYTPVQGEFVVAWQTLTERGNPLWRWKSFLFDEAATGAQPALKGGMLGEEGPGRYRDQRLVLTDVARSAGVRAEAVAIVVEKRP